jgi:cobalt-zinc-cadmium efflux system protein
MSENSHHHGPAEFNRAFAFGVTLNVLFIVIEIGYGFAAHSMALIADAGHNLGDVLSLLLAWGAGFLAQMPATSRRTYGLRKTTILASLASSILLLIAMGGIAWESFGRLLSPGPVAGGGVMAVAGAGVVINGITALFFVSGQKSDLNIRAAFLHMAADAAVSLGVVIAGLVIVLTGWAWLDPAISLAIVAVILVGTWGLFRESLALSIDAIPEHVDHDGIRDYLEELSPVVEIHDLHIWALSTREKALTVHLVVQDDLMEDALLQQIRRHLHSDFGIEHTTIQIEKRGSVAECPFRGCDGPKHLDAANHRSSKGPNSVLTHDSTEETRNSLEFRKTGPSSQRMTSSHSSIGQQGRGATGVVFVLAAFSLLSVLAGCGGGDSGVAQPQKKGPLVQVETVTAAEIVRAIDLTGEVVPIESIQISATVEGPIGFCPWREGDRVEAGQKLIEIDREMYRAEVKAADAALGVAQAKLDDLKAGTRPEEIEKARQSVREAEQSAEFEKSDFDRTAQLVKTGALPGEDLEKARVKHTAAEAKLSAARKQLEMLEAGFTRTAVAVQAAAVKEAAAKLNLAQTRVSECLIAAPFAGTITSVFVRQGDMAAIKAPLLEMADLDSMVVGCGVPMRTAVGTATAMLAATALTGFAGNALHGGFEPALAIPCGAVAIAGGLIGSKIALKTKPKSLKTISGILTIIAAIAMLANALSGRGV